MNITKQFSKVSKQFVITIVATVVLSVGLLAFALYETNVIRFGSDVSSQELHNVVKGEDAVVEYLEGEKDYEAHFVKIASLVKQDQQNATTEALIFTTIPIIILVGGVGFLIAKLLLKPVKESYESQERFIQDAAHELRNPLAAMSLSIQNAEKSKGDKKLLKTMQRQTNRLIRINEDLLYLERRNRGESIKEINISELLEDILEDLQPTINLKKLKLSRNIQPDILMKISPADFIKLSRNIIENAVKYTNKSKAIKVTLSDENGIKLIVKDQGIGIPTKDIDHIGERFFRSKNAAKYDGTGLGIAIVHKVLNLYGGKMNITSAENKGTTVEISF